MESYPQRHINKSINQKSKKEEVPATLPDFIVKKVILTDTNGNEKYQFHKNEEIKMKTLLKNTGDDDIESRCYLSRDSKEEWKFDNTIFAC